MKISIVIPAYNEAESVKPLHREIVQVMDSLGYDYEIIFVDDGSRDGTFDALNSLAPITIVRFRKNFGQTAALDAGIKRAEGDVIVTLDGDGQNDPADIPLLLEKLNEGYDAVSGWRHARKDPFMKRFLSRGARLLRSIFIHDAIHDSGCTLKAYHRYCFDHLDLYGEMHRFIPALLLWRGYSVAEVKVNHRPRRAGISKYKFSRVVRGFLDILGTWFWKKYSARPLHLLGGIGLAFFTMGTLLTGTLFFLRLFRIISLQGSIWPLAGFFLVLVGIQLFVAGLLADISLKNHYTLRGIRPYEIREIVSREKGERISK